MDRPAIIAPNEPVGSWFLDDPNVHRLRRGPRRRRSGRCRIPDEPWATRIDGHAGTLRGSSTRRVSHSATSNYSRPSSAALASTDDCGNPRVVRPSWVL